MASTTATERDLRHLRRAIELAERARGHTSPNPLVGAVVVRGDTVIGEGFHARAGEPHAERMALAACGEDPAGATMYVSLEPCAHTGRTPPCTAAILESGISRVVVASDDPTAKASGRGLGILRDEGVSGRGRGRRGRPRGPPAQPALPQARPHRPAAGGVQVGHVAGRQGGHRRRRLPWISGESSRARAHRWRTECDAVAVGIGTVRADDPLLTSRVEGAGPQPARVVFDSEAALTTGSQLVRTIDQSPVILICSRAAKRARLDPLRNAGVDVMITAGANEAARLGDGLDQLGARGIQSVLLEGGPHLAGVFLASGQIDEARMFVAPILIGGKDSRGAVEADGVTMVADAPRALATEVETIDDDVLITARMREW